MGDPDRRVGGVDRLAAGARGAVDVDPQVVGVDLDLDVLRLRGDQHAGRGGVDPALRLGRRHPLHPVHAALVLQPSPHALAGLGATGLHRDLDVLVAAEVGLVGVDDLGLPADLLRVAEVHPQQVPGEQRRLLTALARLDLKDHVLVVVGVARDQQQPQVLGEFVAPLLQRLDLGVEVRVVGGQLAGGLDVLAGLPPGAVGGGDRGQLGVALGEPARLALVRVDRRIRQPLLENRVLAQELLDCLEHGAVPSSDVRGVQTGADDQDRRGWDRSGATRTAPTGSVPAVLGESAEGNAPDRRRKVASPACGWRRAACRSGPRSGRHGHRCP